MENSSIHISEADNTMLKQKALSYLPRNLGETEAQRQILLMIAQVIPAVTACIDQADQLIWPQVTGKELSINRAIAQCALQVDKCIGSVTLNEQMLKSSPEEALLQAWIALDYYAYVLKAEYSGNIRYFQNQIANVLLTGKSCNEHNGPVDGYDVTQPVKPVDGYDVTQPVKPVDHHDTIQPEKSTHNDPVVSPKWPDDNLNKSDQNLNGNNTVPPKNGKGRKKLALVAALVLAAVLVTAFMLNDTNRTKAAIRKIGTVTLESEENILQAEQLYNELTESQQDKVGNRDVLFAARAEYDRLVTEEAIDQIGKVTMESEDAIVYAEQLYAALSRDARNLVENYKTLTSARKEYDRLEAAVKKASDAIDAIGTVTLQSGSKIEAARKDYDALKKDNLQGYLSNKVSTLTNAEKEYKQLVSQDLYDTGMSRYEERSYEEAIECFDTIIADYSDTKSLESAKKAKADCQVALAEQAYSKRDYYTAMTTLNAVEAGYHNQENYQTLQEKIITALTKARPRSGTVVDGKIGWGRCYFQIIAGNQDVCFKFQNTSDPAKYKLVYVRAGEKAKVNVEDGTYSIKWATGQYWYDKTLLFGDGTEYRSNGTTEFTTTYKGNWVYYWYLDLDMTASDFRSSPIDADNF